MLYRLIPSPPILATALLRICTGPHIIVLAMGNHLGHLPPNQQQTAPHLAHLPPATRRQIYTILHTHSALSPSDRSLLPIGDLFHLFTSPATLRRSFIVRTITTNPLFQVNSVVRREALQVLWEENTVCIATANFTVITEEVEEGVDGLDYASCLLTFVLPHVHLIRHLRVSIDDWRDIHATTSHAMTSSLPDLAGLFQHGAHLVDLEVLPCFRCFGEVNCSLVENEVSGHFYRFQGIVVLVGSSVHRLSVSGSGGSRSGGCLH